MRYIGIDVHKNSLQVAITDEKGKILEEFKVNTTREGFKELLHKLKPSDSVLIEATTNAFQVYDIILEKVKQVAISNPIKTKVIAEARVKTDKKDARTLATLLRLEAYYPVWVPPKSKRRERKFVSLYVQFQRTAVRLKNRIHSILQTNMIKPKVKDIFSEEGKKWLRSLENLSEDDKYEVEICLEVLESVEKNKKKLEKEIEAKAIKDKDVLRLMQIPGINLLSGFIIMSEIGEIERFANSGKLSCYAGLVPSVHQSSQKSYTGRITKAGRKRLRWILIQCANINLRYGVQFRGFYQRIKKKKGHNVAVVAVARKMLEVIWHLLKKEEVYQHLEGGKYANKILSCAYELGKEKNPQGAKETLKGAFDLIGIKIEFDVGSSISLNKIKRDKKTRDKLDEIKPGNKIYVLGK